MKKICSLFLLTILLIVTVAGCAKAPAYSGVIAVSSSAEKYASWLSLRIDSDLGDVLICDSSDADKYDIDLSGLNKGGYTIRKHGNSTVIAGKDDDGLDAAVRYFAKYATAADMNVTEGEGYRVKSITVDGRDISEYTVYVPTEIPANAYAENVDYAADVLIEHIAEACGVNLTKTNTLGGHQIVFAYDGDTYGKEAFNINASDGNIIITGGTSRGPLYGAYGFLEECIGYRFLTRGVVYLYEAENINIENGFTHTEGTETPFKWRDTYTAIDGKTHLYPAGPLHSVYKESNIALHNTGTWQHSWLSSPKYGYGEGPDTNHSAYKLIPSVPDGETPCFSDPETLNECVKNLRKYIGELEGKGYEFGSTMPKISISQNDTDKWCGCDDCMELVRKYGAYSANLIDFISRIYDELKADYPDIEFWMLAYHYSTTKPPVNMEVPENLTVCFCHYLACNNHSVTGKDCTGYTAELGEHFRNWFKVTDNIDVWYYACSFNYSLAPAANLYQMKEDVRYYADMGVKGFFMQNEETTLGFDDLSSYLSAELLWNPYLTDEEYDDLIKEFCKVFYGDGYELIFQYTKLMEEAGDINGCWCALNGAPFTIYNYDYMSANFDYFIELFESAIDMCNTAEQEARLKRLSCHMYFNCIAAQFDETMASGTDDEKALLVNRYQLLYDRLYEIKDTAMFGIFTSDTVPDVFDPTVNPLEWLTQNNSSWGDMMD